MDRVMMSSQRPLIQEPGLHGRYRTSPPPDELSMVCCLPCVFIHKQDRQCTDKRSIEALSLTIVAVEKKDYLF